MVWMGAGHAVDAPPPTDLRFAHDEMGFWVPGEEPRARHCGQHVPSWFSLSPRRTAGRCWPRPPGWGCRPRICPPHVHSRSPFRARLLGDPLCTAHAQGHAPLGGRGDPNTGHLAFWMGRSPVSHVDFFIPSLTCPQTRGCLFHSLGDDPM